MNIKIEFGSLKENKIELLTYRFILSEKGHVVQVFLLVEVSICFSPQLEND